MDIQEDSNEYETVTDKDNKAEEMCLFWTLDKSRWTSKASPRREVQREKKKRKATINLV